MDAPLVTVVIATYNRAALLRVALKSLQRQTLTSWQAIIIGDGCEDSTGEVVRAMNDPRFCYLNLTERFGEQSGPNSIGLALADTEFVAWLNHDDVWFDDHLARAVDALRNRRRSLYFGRSAICGSSIDTAQGSQPEVAWLTPQPRDLLESMRRSFTYEPASAWVLRTEDARCVGNWRSARELHDTPLQDWIKRAARKHLTVLAPAEVTVLKINPWRDQCRYTETTPEHEFIERCWLHLRADELRSQIETLASHATTSTEQLRTARHGLIGSGLIGTIKWLNAALYLHSGIDLLVFRRHKGSVRRGDYLQGLSRARTGRDLPPTPDLSRAIESCAACFRERRARWDRAG